MTSILYAPRAMPGSTPSIYPGNIEGLIEEIDAKPEAEWTAADWGVKARRASLKGGPHPHWKPGDIDKALRLAKKAVDLGDDPAVYYWIADAFNDGKQPRKALQALDAYVEAEPDNEWALKERYEQRLTVGDKKGAKQDLIRWHQQWPGSQYAVEELADFYLDKSRLEKDWMWQFRLWLAVRDANEYGQGKSTPNTTMPEYLDPFFTMKEWAAVRGARRKSK